VATPQLACVIYSYNNLQTYIVDWSTLVSGYNGGNVEAGGPKWKQEGLKAQAPLTLTLC